MADAPDRRPPNDAGEHPTVGRIRRVLLVLLVSGIVVTLAELFLLEHTEDLWQLAPIFILGASLIVTLVHVARPSRTSVRAFQGAMLFVVLSGFIGLYLHYHGNVEFELEMYPSLAGLGLFWEALRGATPTLAPAAMIFLGVVGLAYAHRHSGIDRDRA